MPSSPEVWPPRVPIAQNTHGKGRGEGTLKGTAATVMALNASRGGPKAAAKLACPCPPPHPPPSSGHQAQRATSREATGHFTSAHTRSPLHGSRGTPEATASWSWSSPERGEAGTPSTTPPSSHSSRPPLPPPKPHYAHNLAAATAATLGSSYLRRRFGLRSFPAALRGPSTCRASPARVVTAP